MGKLDSNPIESYEEELERFLSELSADHSLLPTDLVSRYPDRASEIQALVRQQLSDDLADEHSDILPPLPAEPSWIRPADSVTLVSSLRANEAIAAQDLPRRLGDYELQELISCGGMGAVYRGRQLVPIQRSVAIKLIKPDIGGREIVSRFQSECRSLALMNHPNIATVFDGGATRNGHPYLVMELVEGDSLIQHGRRRRLDLEDKLRLFVQVCAGVQHAHQKSVIHRDIKPSNILVTEVDGQARPKVIDFGLAKTLSADFTPVHSSHTQLGQILGTLQYMSPEGASLKPENVDTRSDVFSLGVVLFETLTGTTPLDPKLNSEQPIDERLSLVRKQEPVRPSDRIRKLHRESQSARLQHPQEDASTLDTAFARRLHGDLDAICVKAMATAPSERYESAAALAADIHCYLAGRPVTATHATGLYLVSKFMYRYRKLAATLTGVACLLILATAFSISWAVRASSAESIADARLQETLAANRLKDSAVARAESERQTALDINQFLREDLLLQASPDQEPNRAITLREVVDRSVERIRTRFANRPEVQAELLGTIAEVYMDLGEYDKAEPLWQESHDIFQRSLGPNDLQSINASQGLAQSFLYTGRWREAETRMLDNIRKLAELPDDHSRKIRSTQSDLAIVLGKLGRVQEATDIGEALLAAAQDDPQSTPSLQSIRLNNLAMNLMSQRRYLEALPLMENSYRISLEDLGQTASLTLIRQSNLASLLLRLNRPADAEQHITTGLKLSQEHLGDAHPCTLNLRESEVKLLVQTDQLQPAESRARKLIADAERFHGRGSDLSRTPHLLLASVLRKLDRADEAIQELEKQTRLTVEEFGPDDSRSKKSVRQTASEMNTLKRYDEARDFVVRHWQFDGETFDVPPRIEEMKLIREWTLAVRGQKQWDTLHAACERLLELCPADSSSWDYERWRLQYMNAYALRGLKEYAQAASVLEDALAVIAPLRGDFFPGTQDTHWLLSSVLRRLDRHDDAEPHLKIVLEYRSQISGVDSDFVISVLDGLEDVADHRSENGEFERAASLFHEMIEFCREHLGPSHPQTLSFQNHLGIALRDQRDYYAADAVYQRAVADAGPPTAENLDEYNPLLYNWGLTLNSLERWTKAAEVWDSAINGFHRQFSPEHYRTERCRVYQAQAVLAQGDAKGAQELIQNLARIDRLTNAKNVASRLKACGVFADAAQPQECAALARQFENQYRELARFENIDVWEGSQMALHAATLHRRSGNVDIALALADEALRNRLSQDQTSYKTAVAYGHLATIALSAGKFESAEQAWLEEFRILELDESPSSTRLREWRAVCEQLVELYRTTGDHESELEWADRLRAYTP